MTTLQTQQWQGQSGRIYTYQIVPLHNSFPQAAGNYIFARLDAEQNSWVPVYIGETANLANRIANHEKWGCASQHGATHIHAHINQDGEVIRQAEERDLLLKFRPVCNAVVGAAIPVRYHSATTQSVVGRF